MGFFDESAPQTTANTVRLWSFHKPENYRDTSKYRANTFGFYSINGNSVIDFQDHSRKENVCNFLKSIREKNPEKEIIMVLDNFRSHHSKLVSDIALLLKIRLVFLPPYSPDLNPIEFIWKSIKRIVSTAHINSEYDLKATIKSAFLSLSESRSYAKHWITEFLDNSIIM